MCLLCLFRRLVPFFAEPNRKFLERKVEGPSVLRLWPGLYLDSDTFRDGDGRGGGGSSRSKRRNRLEGEGVAVRMQARISTVPHCCGLHHSSGIATILCGLI